MKRKILLQTQMDREEEENCQNNARDEWGRADNDEYVENSSSITSTTDVWFMLPHLHYVGAQSFGFVWTLNSIIKNGINVDLFVSEVCHPLRCAILWGVPSSEVCHPLRCAIPVVCLNYMVR